MCFNYNLSPICILFVLFVLFFLHMPYYMLINVKLNIMRKHLWELVVFNAFIDGDLS